MRPILTLRQYTRDLIVHSHEHAQLVFGLSGALDFEVEGQGSQVRQQSFVVIPGGAHHACGSPDGSRCLVLDVPDGQWLNDSLGEHADAEPAPRRIMMLKPTDIRPPFTRETARLKVQAAEDAWNSRDPERIALAYSEDTAWRNRGEFLTGREAVKAFLRRKFASEQDYRLRKELWAFDEARISVRFEYEFHHAAGQWFRAYGNENWEFAANGLMTRRFASINDLPITESERKFRWEHSASAA